MPFSLQSSKGYLRKRVMSEKGIEEREDGGDSGSILLPSVPDG